MKYTFTAFGHPNILATHKTTLEITKDNELTRRGDCVIAVAADFSLQRIKEVISSCSGSGCRIKLTIAANGLKEEISAVVNKEFRSDHEIVMRKGGFVSERTLGTHVDKAAADISRELVEKLKSSEVSVSISVEAA